MISTHILFAQSGMPALAQRDGDLKHVVRDLVIAHNSILAKAIRQSGDIGEPLQSDVWPVVATPFDVVLSTGVDQLLVQVDMDPDYKGVHFTGLRQDLQERYSSALQAWLRRQDSVVPGLRYHVNIRLAPSAGCAVNFNTGRLRAEWPVTTGRALVCGH